MRDQTQKVIQTFDRKAHATVAGVLDKAIGSEGAVKIERRNGKFEGDRTYRRGGGSDPEKE